MMGQFRDSGGQAHKKIWGSSRVIKFTRGPMYSRQEIFANLPKIMKLEKISCTRKFPLLQYFVLICVKPRLHAGGVRTCWIDGPCQIWNKLSLEYYQHIHNSVFLCSSVYLYTSAKLPVLLVLYSMGDVTRKVPNDLSRCHTKKRMCAHGHARHSFGMTSTFKIYFVEKKFFSLKIFDFFFFWKVSVIPKEGQERLCVPVLLLVWQRTMTHSRH